MLARHLSLRAMLLGATFLSGSCLPPLLTTSPVQAQQTCMVNGVALGCVTTPGLVSIGNVGSTPGGAGGSAALTNGAAPGSNALATLTSGGSGSSGDSASFFDSASPGGPGGAGGSASLNNSGTIQLSASNDGSAVYGNAVGGTGGNGGNGYATRGGSFAGMGGAGGSVTIVNSATIGVANGNAFGLFGISNGGAGGIGGGNGWYLKDGGGSGGSAGGGLGGSVLITNSGAITTQNIDSIAILAVALGGSGGNGVSYQNTAFQGGEGGDGGAGGGASSIGQGGIARGNSITLSQAAVAVYNTGALSTSQVNGSGIWAIASGGAGGNSGYYSLVSGGNGGFGGTVYVKNVAAISTTGDFGRAVGAMASGGAGGAGGYGYSRDVPFVANGGFGGVGGLITIQAVNSSLVTTGYTAQGIYAVANGGAGGISGSGGNWSSSYSGAGGGGGTGGTVFISQSGTIQTGGKNSAAIYASAAGGAGGALLVPATAINPGQMGGAGGVVNVNANLLPLPSNGYTTAGAQSPGIQITVAGGAGSPGNNGGDGGAGGTATLNAAGQIRTTGANSYGILISAQGGTGGAAAHDADGGLGVGGAGGTGGSVTATNAATITTSGTGASGIVITTAGGNTGTSGSVVWPTPAGDAGSITFYNTGAIAVTGTGAGIALSATGGTAYTPGKGGAGGQVYATVSASVSTAGVASPSANAQIQSPAISIVTNGGAGGNGNFLAYGYVNYGSIGNAGDAGKVKLTVEVDAAGNAPSLTTHGENSPAIYVSGNGGEGGNAIFSQKAYYIGTGGTGGAGAEINIVITSSSLISTSASGSPGIQALSVGGAGGAGASSGAANEISGNGGSGGAGGSITITSNARISTSGSYSPAISATNAGGNGGSGGSDDQYKATGARGDLGGLASPGQGDAVSITNSGQLTTRGDYSTGILVSSTGGSGGAGRYYQGNNGPSSPGGAAAAGGNVSVLNSGGIITSGDVSHGISAASVGGGGYTTASVTNSVLVIVATGGVGGAAANGGTISLNNSGAITTSGVNADGLLAISIGGGGGIASGVGASGTPFNLPAVDIVIGGQSKSAASGGAITLVSAGDIQTSGFDSAGISALSVGGAGGIAGAASSNAYATGFNDTVPAIYVLTVIAGVNGAGGNGGVISVTNSGNVTTGGDLAPGISALSIGGGGGDGSNATTQIYAYGTAPQVKIGATLGGTGGTGSGGSVSLDNTGPVTLSTVGFASDALQAISIGGGGGNAGVGTSYLDTTIPVTGGTLGWLPLALGTSYSLQMNIGNQGGTGSLGGAVSVTNSARLVTTGIDSRGIFAQSVGGSGGNAPAGKASSAATMTLGYALGGTGGSGGNGGTVTVANDPGAVIQTAADGAHGIFAQSIGGGGGTAGTSSADSFASQASSTGSEIVQSSLAKVIDSYLPLFASSIGTSGQITPSISLNMTLGGSGGAAGDGGDVTVSNFGSIATGLSKAGSGDVAVGILAQSVGGGGGTAGAATVSGGSIVTSSLTLGGTGGAQGNGGSVTVNAAGTVSTTGGSAFGVLAQSIGGGGGMAGLSTGAATLQLDMDARLGGTLAEASPQTNSAGGGAVTVSTARATATPSSVTTVGNEAHGIVAQSVGGGGGLFYVNGQNDQLSGQQAYQQTLASDVAALFPIGSFASLSDLVSAFDTQVQAASGTLTLNFGGSQASGGQSTGAGSGNSVTIDASGALYTSGANAFGILAQSIGGGGGFAADGDGTGIANMTIAGSFGNSGTGSVPMSGGAVSVTLNAGSVISTTGSGATAILAQSIGGGGGYLGALEGTGATYQGFLTSGAGYGLAVNANTAGGAVTINALGSSSISTQGANAHGIFAQSLSGGGGLIANSAGILVPSNAQNSTRGSGFAVADGFAPGAISISFLGSLSTSGADSIAIYAQSGVQGTSGAIDRTAPSGASGDITVTINGGTVVGGSGTGAAIVMDGGATNSVTIQSEASVSALSNLAVYAPWGTTTLANYGRLTGNITLSDGPATSGTFTNSGTFTSVANGLVNVGAAGTFSNQGLFNVSGASAIGTSSVTGTFTQAIGGVIAVNIDASSAQTADLLNTNTASSLNGSVQMKVLTSVLPQAYEVMTQSSGVVPMSTASLDLGTQNAPGRYLPVTWAKTSTASTLSVTPQVNFVTPGLNANQASYASHLQSTWNAGGTAPLGTVYANFFNQPTAAAYKAAINAASPALLAAGPLSRIASARTALGAVLSCPYFSDSGTLMGQGDCTWARIDAGTTSYTPNDGTAYSLDTLTYRIGGQKEVAPGWFVGASAAYNLGWYDSGTGMASTNGQGGDVSASLKRQIGPWLISGAVHAGYSSFDASRQSVPGSSTYLSECGYDVWTVGGRLRLEYEMAFETWYLKPYGQLDMVYANVPAFSESGASPYNLNMAQADSFTLAFGPHLEIGGRLNLDGGATLRPFASVGATFFSNGSWGVVASLQDAPASVGTFQTVGNLPDVVADLGVGLQLSLKSGLDLRLNYEAEVGTDYLAQTGSARLSYRF